MERDTFEGWASWLARHKGKAIGGGIGFAFAVVVLRYGLVAALFVSLCTLIGYLLGSEDGRERLRRSILKVVRWWDAARVAFRRGKMR